MKGPLFREVSQSLQLILFSAVTMTVYVGLGLFAVRVFG